MLTQGEEKISDKIVPDYEDMELRLMNKIRMQLPWCDEEQVKKIAVITYDLIVKHFI